jgi:hypothetical protein
MKMKMKMLGENTWPRHPDQLRVTKKIFIDQDDEIESLLLGNSL